MNAVVDLERTDDVGKVTIECDAAVAYDEVDPGKLGAATITVTSDNKLVLSVYNEDGELHCVRHVTVNHIHGMC